jgi:hypothetical protein
MSDPLVADLLGPGWYPFENGFRWMGRQASVRMPGPQSAGQKLYVTAICPVAQLKSGPLAMVVSVDGAKLPPVEFRKGNVESTFDFALPKGVLGKSEIEVGIEVSRTVRVGADTRALGLAFGKLEVK